jgi:hypothetical protein
LADDQIVHAIQLGRFGAILGVLDRSCHPLKRYANQDVVHRQFEAHYVLDGHDLFVVLLIT